jgi:hypothetical protein
MFSQRSGYENNIPIEIREDAPQGLRTRILNFARMGYGKFLNPHFVDIHELIDIIWGILSEPGIQGTKEELATQAEQLISQCKWYKCYDIAEAFFSHLNKKYDKSMSVGNEFSTQYSNKLNKYFIENGIGYKMENGKILARFSEPNEALIHESIKKLEKDKHTNAGKELMEAYSDISRRPTPDLTGAIQHSRAALECVVRTITNNPKDTLGKLINDNKNLFPGAIKKIVDGIHGYSSEEGVHIDEMTNPTFKTAELMVSLSSAFCSFLLKSKI